MGAVGEVRTDGDGGAIVDILTEQHYFERMFTDVQYTTSPWPAHLVWID